MVTVDTIGRVRRAYFVQKRSSRLTYHFSFGQPF